MMNKEESQTVLLADVSGSVRLHEKLGGAEAQRAVDRCLKRVERAVDAYEGKVVRAVGDELLIVFARVDRAFNAALEMQQRVADLPAVSGVKLAIRIGFALGAISEEKDRIVGEAVNVAAHLAGLAKPGQILTGIESVDALPQVLRGALREVGPAAAKGSFPGTTIFEAVSDTAPEAPAEPAAAHGARLLLRYAGEVLVVDEVRPLLAIGRDVENGLVIKGKRASRNHAKIECKGNKFILVDESTNGTYLTLGNAREILLRREARVIFGKGVICLAASAGREDVDRIEFEEL
jgi:class 3 adenylate cyclase